MEDHRDRGERLLEAVVAIGAGLVLAEVLTRVVQAAVDLVGVDSGVLAVLTPDGSRFAELVQVGMDADTLEWLARSDAPLDDPVSRGLFAVPVLAAGDVFGHLYLRVAEGTFTSEHEEAARSVAIVAGLAVQNARLFEQSRRREAWLRASSEITATLLAGDHPAGELRLVTERARQVAGAPFAALALPDEHDESTLIFHAVDGIGEEQLTGVTIDVVGTGSGTVFSTGKPQLVDDYGDSAAAWHGEAATEIHLALKALGSGAIVPLVAGAHVLGVLVLVRRRGEAPFGRLDLQLLENFAAHAAMALQYARARAAQHRLVVYEDRDRIAKDLHDLVIQRIYATGMTLEAAANQIGVNPDNATANVRRAIGDLDRTIREIRTTVFALQQPPGSPYGLRAKVIEVAEEAISMLGFAPSIRFEGPVDTVVGDDITEQTVAVVREALSNAARHARASAVSIEISAHDQLEVLVTDNGTGPPEGGRRSGLANLAARAAQHGGTFAIRPTRPGTELRWRVPFET